MKYAVALTFLIFLAVGCASKDAPTTAATPPPSGVVTIGWPVISAGVYMSGLASGSIYIADENGPVTNAAVTFTYTGGASRCVYNSNQTRPVTLNGYILINVIMGYYNSVIFSTNPQGQPCTVSATFGGKTYSSSITTVGNINFNSSATGVTYVWSGAETNSLLGYCGPSECVTVAQGVHSPYYLDNGYIAGYSPGTFDTWANIVKDVPFAGLSSSSDFKSETDNDVTY